MRTNNYSKKISFIISFLIIVSLIHIWANKDTKVKDESTLTKTHSLELNFLTPPNQAKPQVWWHWMNGHISSNGITRELEDMKKVGIGGFTLFNTSEGTPAGPVKYMSDEWFKMLEHTIKEAERLGLEMRIHNGAGWSSTGGPWTTPDQAMQEVVWTETHISGPILLDSLIDIPEPALGIERDMKKDPEINKRYYVQREKVRGFYNDIAVLAFPRLNSDSTSNPFRLENWWEKAGFAKLRKEYIPDKRVVSPSDCIDIHQIVNLTSKIDNEGKIMWQVPPGEWTILRFGYQPTGRQNHPAPLEGRGLEIDKLSSLAVDNYWQNSIAKIIHTGNVQSGKVFKGILIDSYEVGHQNWNSSLPQNFQYLRGYDLTPYLPTLTGRIVESVNTTERFLWDFRKTLSDLIIQNYYGRFYDLCKQNELELSAETYGVYGNTDDFTASAIPDIPMAEWWAFGNDSHHAATAKLASSSAHIYGKKIIDSEAFTGSGNRIFEEHPYALKAQGDYFFCQGINRFSFHTYTHDPYNHPPGIGLGYYGSRFARNTWWPFASPWLEYLARCQYLLQEGKFVADILYYTGEDAPQEAQMRDHIIPRPPNGFDYDFCNSEILDQIKVTKNQLTLPTGISYRILVLPPKPHMSLKVLKSIEKLIAAGATVVGPKPIATPNLSNNCKDEEDLKKISDLIWGKCDAKTITSNSYKKGHVIWGKSLETIFNELKLLPDFTHKVINNKDYGSTQYPGDGIEYIHENIDEMNFYFVSNQHNKSMIIEATFRIENKLPELWDPTTGKIEVATEFKTSPDGRMIVTLRLDPLGSTFVVFRQPLEDKIGIISAVKNQNHADVFLRRKGNEFYIQSKEIGEYKVVFSDGKSSKIIVNSIPKTIDLTGPWQVFFFSSYDTPDKIKMSKLISLSEHNNPDIRYFSGTAKYSLHLDVPSDILSKEYRNFIDLGDIKVVSEIVINGKSQGILWKEPYSMDITNSLNPGDNKIEIYVANLWINRLIGDEQYPDDCDWTSETGSTANGLGLAKLPDWIINDLPRPSQRKAFVTWKWPHIKNKKPLPSGLIGPVRLITQVEKRIDI